MLTVFYWFCIVLAIGISIAVILFLIGVIQGMISGYRKSQAALEEYRWQQVTNDIIENPERITSYLPAGGGSFVSRIDRRN